MHDLLTNNCDDTSNFVFVVESTSYSSGSKSNDNDESASDFENYDETTDDDAISITIMEQQCAFQMGQKLG